MNLHLVGGFLGSGKTTAIVGAAKRLLAQGKRVGVITNDQGRFLVDTAFFRLADLPAVEVTGGCFCCNYDDLEARLEQIVAQARPDVVFAESVGSCADLVATVMKPLLSLGGGRFAPRSFSAFADARLLRRRLLGLEMPFSEDVVYIFDQQMTEAELLVINKADLLPPAGLQELRGLVAARFAGRPVLYQDSLNLNGQGAVSEGVQGISGISTWVERIENGAVGLPQQSLEMDYSRYGAGEADLAWLDEEIELSGGQVSAFIRHFLGVLAESLQAAGAPVGHIKLLVQPQGQGEVKLSLTAGDLLADLVMEGLPELCGPANLILNARVQVAAQELRRLAAHSLAAASQATGVAFTETAISFFHPSFPRPTHRL
jgi:Ni2+-binding GTPase involved in maturation of urease and hydrogenase